MGNRIARVASALVGLFLVLAVPALAQQTQCFSINGMYSETQAAPPQVPNDPFGRGVGTFIGDFGGVTNASITVFLTTPPAFSATSGTANVMGVRHVFSTGPGDSVNFLGRTLFIPTPVVLPPALAAVPINVPGTPGPTIQNSQCPQNPCICNVTQVLDIVGGTGRFAGVTGQLRGLGQGNLDFINGRAGFVFIGTGEICFPK